MHLDTGINLSLTKNAITWEQIPMKYGKMPGTMEFHQFFTHGHNLYNIGGSKTGVKHNAILN